MSMSSLSAPALEIAAPPAPLQLGSRIIDWSRTYLMGVVNVTPDSFSDGGRFLDAATAVEQGRELVDSGAD